MAGKKFATASHYLEANDQRHSHVPMQLRVRKNEAYKGPKPV